MSLDLRAELEGELEALADERHCATARDIAGDLISLTLPPEDLSTTECAERFRFMRAREGKGKRRWLRSLTPYVCAIQDALDDPRYRFVAVVGPGRAGKSVAGENHLFKRLRNGPLVDCIIYLQADSDVSSYADKEFRDFFELHEEIRSKVGTRPTDNKRNLKNVAGRTIQLLPANLSNVRQKEATFIIATEIDGYRPAVRDGFKDNIATRMQASGNQAKAYVESHPDCGWTGPMVTIYTDSTRGLWFWPCPHCEQVSCPHPLAPRGMFMDLVYDRQDSLGHDAMLDLVEQSASLRCPHCAGLIGDGQKQWMLDRGFWVFAGQTVVADGTITGAPRESDAAGFWIHGTMSPFISLGEMARKYVAALVHFENTKRPARLKEVVVKTFGEVYEGAGAGTSAVDAKRLTERSANDDGAFDVGTCPDGVKFITASVDVGGSKFDVMIVGWDLEGRSWIIDRFTIRQRMVNGRMRDIRPAERQDDWLVLRDEVLHREIPLASDPDMRMPIAGMAIDTGDGHVTWKAREFARRMARAGEAWGSGPAAWQKVRLIKGARLRDAPELPSKGREIGVDERGRPVKPSLLEWDLGVHKLKTQSIERLAEQEDGPGYVRFAVGLPQSAFTEFGGEVLIDGKWERRGPNESLDLFGYAEAVRLMLRPDRSDIKWDVRPPVWARPVPINDNDPSDMERTPLRAAPAGGSPKKNALARLAALNRR